MVVMLTVALITVGEGALSSVGERFYALQYDGPGKFWDEVLGRMVWGRSPFESPMALFWLKPLRVRVVRTWAKVQDFHPKPGEWIWKGIDRPVREIVKAGFEVLLCLNQGSGSWFVGDERKPWWEFDEGRREWEAAARALAERFEGKAVMIEIFNEPNLLHKERPNYMGWERSVELYLLAARAIKQVAPSILCGGPASWAGWETAEWGKRVISRPGGERLLDFLSYHIYTTHKIDEPDEVVMARTPWFEEAPLYISREMGKVTKKRILRALTEFNFSAVCERDGKAWTDPRNRNALGGVWLASALLHSAKGGCDIAFHFSTQGGFGVLVWPPNWRPWPAYYAWRLLVEGAGLLPGAKILECTTTEEARRTASVKLPVYDLEPFAIRRTDGGVSVVLVNRTKRPIKAEVCWPAEAREVEVYVFSTERVADSLWPVRRRKREGKWLDIDCPPISVTVLRFE